MPPPKPVPQEEDTNKSGKKPAGNQAGAKPKLVESTPQRVDYELHSPSAKLLKAIEPVANKWFSPQQFKKVKFLQNIKVQ